MEGNIAEDAQSELGLGILLSQWKRRCSCCAWASGRIGVVGCNYEPIEVIDELSDDAWGSWDIGNVLFIPLHLLLPNKFALTGLLTFVPCVTALISTSRWYYSLPSGSQWFRRAYWDE
jgi:hypothetical protein